MAAYRDNRRFREQGLAFFAKIVAGQGHEITNVLNIINELNGLLQDLMSGADRGSALNIERFRAISEKIQFQVQRGENMVRQVRAFAHNADLPVTVFDLKTVLEQVVFLAERHTRLNKAALTTDFPEESTALECSPFELQQAVFVAVDAALFTAKLPEHIAVGYRIEQEYARIHVKSEAAFAGEPAVEDRVSFLGELLTELGGERLEVPQTGRPFPVGFRLSKVAATRTNRAASEQRTN